MQILKKIKKPNFKKLNFKKLNLKNFQFTNVPFKINGLTLELFLSNVLILLIALSLIGFISFSVASRAMIDSTQESLEKYASEGGAHIAEKISGDLSALETLASQSEIISMDWSLQKPLLESQTINLVYNDMGIIDLKGQGIYASNNATFTTNQEDYFEKALQGISNTSDLIFSTPDNELAILEVVPIKNNGSIMGLLIGKRDPFFIMDQIENMNDGGRQHAFILSTSGQFITHPNKSNITNQVDIFSDDDWSEFSQNWQNLEPGKAGLITYSQKNRIHYAAVFPIVNSNWILVISKYEDYILTPIIQLRTITIITSLVIILISSIFVFLNGRRITKPIIKVKEAADSLALGNVDIELKTNRKDEILDLIKSFQKMASTRKEQSEILTRLSSGDLSSQITPLSEDDIISFSMIDLTSSINQLLKEQEQLHNAAAKGNLSFRGNSECFSGAFKNCISGMNEIIDQLVAPLYSSVQILQEIGQGNIPPKMTADYQGDFNQMKESINNCIDGLEALNQGDQILHQMSLNQFSDHLSENYKGIFGSIARSINQVQNKLVQVVEISGYLAKGQVRSIPLLDELKAVGPLSNQDQLNPNLIMMMENIDKLSCEIQTLTQHAREGQLSYRGNTNIFSGEYALIISGINQTLDAIVHPIESATNTLHQLAQGNLQIQMDGEYTGAYSLMQKDMNQTINQLKHYIKTISELLIEIGNGNLNLNITSIDQGDFIEIRRSIEMIIQSLSQTLGEIDLAASQVDAGTSQISQEAQALSEGANQQADAIEILSSFIEEMRLEVIQNASNANQSNQLILSVKEESESGNLLMKDLIESMNGINQTSQNISEIMSLINVIAFQTKILSLNAAIEAARAGEHGKGFSVVANEVRNLANRTTQAAEKIDLLISASMKEVQLGNQLVDNTNQHLKNIHLQIEEASQQIDSIVIASEARANNMEAVNDRIESIRSVILSNASAVEETASASEELSSQADFLKQMINQFTLIS